MRGQSTCRIEASWLDESGEWRQGPSADMSSADAQLLGLVMSAVDALLKNGVDREAIEQWAYRILGTDAEAWEALCKRDAAAILGGCESLH